MRKMKYDYGYVIDSNALEALSAQNWNLLSLQHIAPFGILTQLDTKSQSKHVQTIDRTHMDPLLPLQHWYPSGPMFFRSLAFSALQSCGPYTTDIHG